ncbi:MAG: NAD(+)/NADH kinase [Nannocystaceae bacterium]|nr:NAD(+)/NADH kinase [Myxococcales bacterium]
MLTRQKIPPVRRVVLYPREDGRAMAKVVLGVAWLVERGISVAVPRPLFEQRKAELPAACGGVTQDELDSSVDLVVAFGGDGTLLRAARWAAPVGLPVLGVNLGDLGFLSAFHGDRMLEGLQAAVAGELLWEPRLRMRVVVVRDGEVLERATACNDAYVKHGNIPRLLQLATTVGGEQMATYRCDGLIICTPMGSTAYNLAAGGPIVDPGTEVFTISPICPHSLTHRPVVVAANTDINVTYAGPRDISEAFLTVDGEQSIELKVDDSVHITQAERPLKLVSPESNVFEVLAAKLGWSGPR